MFRIPFNATPFTLCGHLLTESFIIACTISSDYSKVSKQSILIKHTNTLSTQDWPNMMALQYFKSQQNLL